MAPTPLVVFSYKPGGITTVSEAGVPAASGTAFRMYAESLGIPGQPDNIQAGIAVTNNGSTTATVTFELFNLDGSTTGMPAPAFLTLPAFGHAGKFLAEIFQGQSLPNPFKGIVRISTTSTSGVSVVGLRTRHNERLDFLITTTPPTDEAAPASSEERFFPQVADGGGYTTQLVLYSGQPGAASGTIRLLSPSGGPLNVPLH
jgi:hypothetical protein